MLIFFRTILFFLIQQSEGITRKCSVKKLFLEISQYSQENTCARVSFESCRVCNFIKKDTLPRCFPGNFAKFARISFLTEHLRLLFLNICNLYLELITSSCDSSFGIVEDFWFRRGYREIPNVCTEFSNTSINISKSVHHNGLCLCYRYI